MIRIGNGILSASINPLGAELSSLRDAAGRELMTDADPRFWTGRAPILFPIVGALRAGGPYPLAKHGFARHKMFEVVEVKAESARLRLVANEETLAAYPWRFSLEIGFALAGATLTVEALVRNHGDATMPASFGFHPAFAWPLPYGRAREDHRIVFAADEPEPLRAITPDGLIAAARRPSPLDGRTLHLADALFADDALVWDSVRSQRVTYGAGDGPQLVVDFPDTPMLGIWTRPGAHFVCIEPWHGMADEAGVERAFADKPGSFVLAPDAAKRIAMAISLDEAGRSA